jgi:hypothetical protein
MRKTNHVTHGERGARHASRQRAPRRTHVLEDVANVATRIVPRGNVKRGAIAGTAVLATTGALTAGYFGRKQISDAALQAAKQLGKWGTSVATMAGLRRKPIYMRAWPTIGIGAGLLAIGSAAVMILPRLRGSAKEMTEKMTEKMETQTRLGENDSPQGQSRFPERGLGAGSYHEHR